MKRYILDTNIVSDLQTETEIGLRIVEKLKNLDAEDEVSVSIIVLYELVYGLNNLSDEKQKNVVEEGIEFIKEYLSIIPLDLKEVDIFAKLKTKYKQSTGINKNAIKRHNLDLLIASTAIALDAIIVSDDAIFKKLAKIEPLLKYENWLR
jgi:predicted nucleic acid-binding protein